MKYLSLIPLLLLTSISNTEVNNLPLPATTDIALDASGKSAPIDISIKNYISITIDGQTTLLRDAQFEAIDDATFIYAQEVTSETTNTYIGFGGLNEGDYSADNFVAVLRSDVYNWELLPKKDGGGFSTFEVTQYGDRLVGHFSGEVIDLRSGKVTLAGGRFDIGM